MNLDKVRFAADPKIKQAQVIAMEKARQKRAEAYRLKESGMTFQQVADKLGCSWQRAQFLVHRYHKLDKPKKKNGG